MKTSRDPARRGVDLVPRSSTLGDNAEMKSLICSLVILVGCGSPPPATCNGSSCTCAANADCDITHSGCGGNSCSLECGAGASCSGTCGTSCSINCGPNADCDVTM